MQSLKLGSKGTGVSTVQQYLQSLGLYNGKIDGSYGPQTQGAVTRYQQAQGLIPDGVVGPLTENKIQANTIASHPAVQAAMASDPSYAAAMNGILNNPQLSNAAGSAYSMIADGTFTPEQYATQYQDQYNALDSYYKENQNYGQTDAENTLGNNARDYAHTTDANDQQFNTDKQAADADAASKGVLFSTGRAQDQTTLQNKYQNAADTAADNYSSGVNTTLNNYAYKYGTPAVASLSQYTTAPGASQYNAGSGVATKGGLASIYNPVSNSSYYGTNNTDEQANAGQNTNAYFANILNKGNIAATK